MTRRVIVRRLVVPALVAVAVLGLILSTTASRRPTTVSARQVVKGPNIVFVLTDDLSMNLLRYMPHVRAMQQEGTTLSRYHVVDSLCCPSRTAIFTGQYPHNNGVFTNSGADGGYGAYNEHGNEQKSFALALQRKGYRTGFMGKYLNGYNPNYHVAPGWDEWDVAGGGGYSEFNYGLNENGVIRRYGRRPNAYLTDVLSQKGSEFIRTSYKPFFLEIATFAPHAPATPAPRDANFSRDITYPKTPAWNRTPTDPPIWLQGLKRLTPLWQHKLLVAYRKRVASVRSVDAMIGNLQAALRAKGVARNTYIVFSSDNGFHMGEYGLLAGKQTAFDTDTHVPLVVTGPGVPAGHTTDKLASNVDLAPTFESIAGAPIGNVDGVDLSPLWHGQDPARWQQGILIEHHGPNDRPDDPDRQNFYHGRPPSYEAIRTADALYVEYVDGEREYYNTRADPYQLDNLAPIAVPDELPRMLHEMQACVGAAECQRAAGA